MDLTLNLLLNKRDYDYAAFSRKIIAMFSEKLTKAVQMQFKFDRDIVWTSVDSFRAVDGYVLVHGTVEVQAGDIITVEGEEILITEDNIRKYHRPLRYVLNARVLQHGSLETLFQHIIFVTELAVNLTDAEIVPALLSGELNNANVTDNPVLAPIIEKITRPSVFESFDTQDLTPTQYQSLRLCASMGKTEKNN